MSDTNTIIEKPLLGVGQIISESFSLLFQNIVAIVVAAFVPILLSLVLSGLMLGFGVTLGQEEPDLQASGVVAMFVLNALLSMAIYGIVTAIIVQLAYDAKLGRGTSFASYMSNAIQTLIPNVLQTLAISFMAAFAMIALVVPGLWVYAVFSVTIPALVIERVGFGAMSRSAELTKEYRWPVLGAMIVILIASMILNLIPAFLIGLVFSTLGPTAIAITMVLTAVLYTLTYGLVGIGVSLIYARLREIKEGVGVDNLASVFE